MINEELNMRLNGGWPGRLTMEIGNKDTTSASTADHLHQDHIQSRPAPGPANEH